MLETLTLFYTYQLRGQLDSLPRLYTFLERQRQGQGASILLDCGESCDKSQWHCQATENRSTVIALDGMGYHAVNVAGVLSEEARTKLLNVTTTALVDEQHSWRYNVPPHREEGILIAHSPTPALLLCVVLSPATHTHLDGNTLFLGTINGHQVGKVRLSLAPLTLIGAETLTVPSTLPPHPTITGAIEFIQEEARYYAKK